MEVVTGALPSVIAKLADLVAGEYNLQKGVKEQIVFLHNELKHMQGALQKISNTPADQRDIQDKIWASDLRELSYDIEDSIDTFKVRGKGSESGTLHGIKKFIGTGIGLLKQAKIRHGIATEIKDIKEHVEEVSRRRHHYKIDNAAAQPVTIDPRLFSQYKNVRELVGIDEAREEVLKILMEGNEESKQRNKIVSIVGFGGLGKTTLANVVYAQLRAQFDCSAFVSVSQTPDMEKVLNDMLHQLAGKRSDASINIIVKEITEFLQNRRYFIVLDDIWDVSVWKKIESVLPANDFGNRIITTTRNVKVAQHAGGAYEMKPLSLDNSRKLLYGRVFGNDNNEDTECPDKKLAEVSNKILKKCAGVPLAIVTMASLLACKGRDETEWYEVCNSVGAGLENSLDLDNMRKILSFSYYDMPSHLRTCLLYLSMFPEDFEIDKDSLIWMWIAEGFLECENEGKSIFSVGESYFNELINRSMIQPSLSYGEIIGCRVHDMVLDLIRALSSAENFVTILNVMDHTVPSSIIRRLSLQNCKEDHAATLAPSKLKQVRSVVYFPLAVNVMPAAVWNIRVLRVLELKGFNLSQGHHSLKCLRNLLHLRYLGLRGTHITQIPEEIGNLQFLQMLDVKNNEIPSLPSTVVQLRNLMCLHIDESTRVPNGIGNLACLEVLSCLCIDDSTMDILEEVGQLTKLRVLCICCKDNWNDKLVGSLCKLPKIQKLHIIERSYQCNSVGGLDAWVASRHLRSLDTKDACWFSTLPAWMNDLSLVSQLSYLRITVKEVRQHDLEILGRLPALRYLGLMVDHYKLGLPGSRFVVGAGSFPCLVSCCLQGFVGLLEFRRGAMLCLTQLFITPFYVREVRETVSSDGGLDLGLGNLPSLQYVRVDLRSGGASKEELEQVKAALTRAAETHPNRPAHGLYMD